MLEAGQLCRVTQDGREYIALALSDADAEGEARFVFAAGDGNGFALTDEDFRTQHEALVLRTDKPRFLPVTQVKEVLGSVQPSTLERLARSLVAEEVKRYFPVGHAKHAFVPGSTRIPVSGRTYGVEEVLSLADAALDFWLTSGRFNTAFETAFKRFLGRKHVLTVNSGSSANLLAVAALTSPTLGDKAISAGDEVITVAAGFPTTVNPLFTYGLIPVFVDTHIPTYNIDPNRIEAAISEKTRAIVLAHSLGNPFDLARVQVLAEKYDLWLIEDSCDALGSRYQDKLVGTFGHIATFSFYPAHHITMGEGGAVATDDPILKRALESFRDWGRDCWCDPGRDNTCRKRFDWRLGGLPRGYDHKYVYSHLGYNLKITDMQAAVGLAQMQRLPDFIWTRKRNFDLLYRKLKPLRDYLVLPEATVGSEPAWFGFPLTLRERGQREQLLRFLNERSVDTRLLFGGNLTRQPYLAGHHYRVAGELDNSDRIMHDTFWLGVYPGLTEAMLDFTAQSLGEFFNGR